MGNPFQNKADQIYKLTLQTKHCKMDGCKQTWRALPDCKQEFHSERCEIAWCKKEGIPTFRRSRGSLAAKEPRKAAPWASLKREKTKKVKKGG